MNIRLQHTLLGVIVALMSVEDCHSTGSEQHRVAQLVTQLLELESSQSAVAINNKLISLGKFSVPKVTKLLQSSDVRDRTNAAWILGEIQSIAALPAIKRALVTEADDTAKEFEVQAICSILHIRNNITPQEAIVATEDSNQRVQQPR